MKRFMGSVTDAYAIGCRGVRLAACIAWILLLPTATLCQDRTVSVLYAGSLAGVMENGVGPNFTAKTGLSYQGEAQGSLGGAHLIRDRLRSPDVFISADPSVNREVLMGRENGNLVEWFMTVAASQLVVAYDPHGKFASRFEDVRSGQMPWYELLETPGVRFGRGDPRIDPKGYRTIFMFRLAARHYQRPEIAALLGDPVNPAQVFPEIVLLARLEAGEFDAGIFYKHEAVAHKLPFISLPAEINLGDPRFAASYGRETFDTESGEHIVAAPILFTVAIPRSVRHPQSALAFVKFLLSSETLLTQYGFTAAPHQFGGDPNAIPQVLREFSSGAFQP